MQGGAMASGPLARDRVGVLLAAAWTRSSQFDRRRVAGDAGAVSVFSNLLFTPGAQNEVSTIAWIQAGRYPSSGRIPYGTFGSSDRDRSTHVQTSWQRHAGLGVSWRAFGALTMRMRDAAAADSNPATIERL